MDKNSFIIYKDFYEPVKDLDDKDLGALFRAIFEYQINGVDPGPGSPVKLPFAFFKNQFRIDDEKYERIVERNRANGQKGGRPAQPNKPTGKTGKPGAPKKADNDNGNGNENVTVIDNENGILYPWEGPQFLGAWSEWKQYKKDQFRFTYKNRTSEQTALKQLHKLASGSLDTALLIMEQSIANGWKGFFTVKQDTKHQPGKVDQEYINELQQRLGHHE